MFQTLLLYPCFINNERKKLFFAEFESPAPRRVIDIVFNLFPNNMIKNIWTKLTTN